MWFYTSNNGNRDLWRGGWKKNKTEKADDIVERFIANNFENKDEVHLNNITIPHKKLLKKNIWG